MQITSQTIGEGYFKQLQINITLGLPVVLKVVCRSASRNDTSYEIFDQEGMSMGCRAFEYASRCINRELVDDLNVLLEEFGKVLDYDEFRPVSKQIAQTCESRYGNGLFDGDVIITLQ